MKNIIIEKVFKDNASKSVEDIIPLVSKEFTKEGYKAATKAERKQIRNLVQYFKDQNK
jgi:hypothetical protein